MTTKTLTSGVAEKNTGPAKEMVFACDFATDGAIQLKTNTASAFITVHTFSADEAVKVLIPGNAEYQSTGASEITVSYDE